jgi:hypothetical protein
MDVLHMTSSDDAAWLSAFAAVGQAVFSVGAIAAAAWIAGRQERTAAMVRGEEAEGRKIAEALATAADERGSYIAARDNAIVIASSLATWNEAFVGWRSAFDNDELAAKWVALRSIVDRTVPLDLPPPIARLAGNLRVLGMAAENVQRVVVKRDVLDFKRKAIAEATAHETKSGNFNEALRDSLFAHVKEFAFAVDKANTTINGLLNS